VLDLFLIMSLGFLGSFGHCAGMCGPLAVAFSLSTQSSTANSQPSTANSFYFHILLNLGRMLSYALVGAALGSLSSVLVAGGQLAGVSSGLRQWIAIITGIMLIWFGLVQIKPEFLPRIPILNPLAKVSLHNSLSSAMMKLSMISRWWTPALLGGVWGLIPCGFLYAAQIKAAQTSNIWMGAATMLAFGIGTLPTMLAVGVFASKISADRRSQLFRMGGWVTLTIGILTLLRTGEMVDYTGHAALILLILALVARPISRLWSPLLKYRRALGVGAFVLAVAHTSHMLSMTLNWNINSVSFMLPRHQLGVVSGTLGLLLMTPAALTSFDKLQKKLGQSWRKIHLLTVPALILCVIHAIAIGSSYLGAWNWTWKNQLLTVLLSLIGILTLLIRRAWFWSLLSLEKYYVSPNK
jgi:uncharacterized protein